MATRTSQSSFAAENVDSNTMSIYLFYTALLVAKMLLGVLLVTITRMRTQIFSNPEDAPAFENKKGKAKVAVSHPDLDRVLRMHAHDIENNVPFIIIGLVYAMTIQDGYVFAHWCFRAFLAARCLTSISHYYSLQPWRTLFYIAGVTVCWTMLVVIFMKAGSPLRYL